MYLHLSKLNAQLVQTILLEKQAELINRCQEELERKNFNVRAYHDADLKSRQLDLILEQFEP